MRRILHPSLASALALGAALLVSACTSKSSEKEAEAEKTDTQRAEIPAAAAEEEAPERQEAPAKAAIDQLAPAFTLKDWDGEERSLSDYRGKTVVLEWTNDGCPFVKKHYNSGNMQALQRRWQEQGVVWITINSSSEGKQGHISPDGAKALMKEQEASPDAYLFDPVGKVGMAYNAQTTPHMYVIDPQGVLRYMGAIDDRPTADLADIEGATNYVQLALTELAEGKAVRTKATRAYGCNVKYPGVD